MGFETFIDEITTTANRGLASGGLIAKFNGISSIELCTKLNICASIAPPTQSPETLAAIASKQITKENVKKKLVNNSISNYWFLL